MQHTSQALILTLLLAPAAGIVLGGCSDDSDRPTDDTAVATDGTAGEKKVHPDGTVLHDKGPDLAVDQAVTPPDATSPDKSCGTGKIACNCIYKGKKLYGKVKIVSSFEDFKVRVVSSFEDLRVEKVSSFPSSCGEWQIVTSFEDFKVREVSSLEDFKVRYVSSFPGL